MQYILDPNGHSKYGYILNVLDSSLKRLWLQFIELQVKIIVRYIKNNLLCRILVSFNWVMIEIRAFFVVKVIGIIALSMKFEETVFFRSKVVSNDAIYVSGYVTWRGTL